MMRPSPLLARLAIAGLALIATAGGARADLILAFGQLGPGSPVVASNPTATSTRISALNAAIVVTAIDPSSGLGVPFAAFLNFVADSTATGVQIGNEISQEFAGTFAITSGANGTGINYLSGTFNDVASGSGTALTMSASDVTVGESVSFTSDLITSLDSPRGLSLAFVGLSPALALVNGTIAPFTAGISGNFSAAPVPEPSTAAAALGGLLLLGGALRRRRAAR